MEKWFTPALAVGFSENLYHWRVGKGGRKRVTEHGDE